MGQPPAHDAFDSAGVVTGYYDSPFPGEDGGPRRQFIPRALGLVLGAGQAISVIARPAFTVVCERHRWEIYSGPITVGKDLQQIVIE